MFLKNWLARNIFLRLFLMRNNIEWLSSVFFFWIEIKIIWSFSSLLARLETSLAFPFIHIYGTNNRQRGVKNKLSRHFMARLTDKQWRWRGIWRMMMSRVESIRKRKNIDIRNDAWQVMEWINSREAILIFSDKRNEYSFDALHSKKNMNDRKHQKISLNIKLQTL